MTLLELLVSMSVMLLVVGTLAGLAKGVQLSFEHGEAYGTITQHARVSLDRIARTVNKAHASNQFPGVLVVSDYEGGEWFPETLVVWHPKDKPIAPEGLPQLNELVIYCPSRYPYSAGEKPNCLVEIVIASSTTGAVHAATDTTWWQTTIQNIRRSIEGDLLTSLVRATALTGGRVRGAVRFERVLTPSDEELTGWKTAGSTSSAWDNLPWAHAIRASRATPYSGLRQARVRIELQLLRSPTDAAGPEASEAVPFFASAAIYYKKSSEIIP